MDIEYIESFNTNESHSREDISKSGRFLRRPTVERKICAKDERNASIKKVSQILQKRENERTIDDLQTLTQCSDAVEEVKLRWRKRDEAKRRVEEVEEPMEQLAAKCQVLAQAIAQSQHLVVYTGAGISTAAQIPDYRGSNGIWTRLQQGKDIGNHDLSQAEPTFTHMALSELYRRNILKYVVSQNCDGLHLRSGLPKTALSELHGNMYIEVCKSCKPVKEYWRNFDVTENTARFSHKTMRKCYVCNGSLVDTIVHFGERGSLQWPLNWSGACKNAKKATTIICLGSSLKVLKKYPWLWQMDKPVKKRPNLYIINLQWTPKDECANIKIHGKCDIVMKIVMEMLGITVPSYDREKDPIFIHSSNLCDDEVHTTTQPFLKFIDSKNDTFQLKEEYVQTNKTASDDQECHNNLNIKTEDLTDSTNNLVPNNLLKLVTTNVDCDNASNINTNFTESSNTSHNHNSLPSLAKNVSHSVLPPKTSGFCTAFSIDNILDTENKSKTFHVNSNINAESQQAATVKNEESVPFIENNIIMNHRYAILRYYQISNILFQNHMGYHDMVYYPFQTSLLYPGLHNIIKPSSYYGENFISNNFNENCSLIQENVLKKEFPACDFCDKNYKSVFCLFYTKTEPNFQCPEFRISKLDNIKKPITCICCDYSTDEDEDLENEDDNELPDKIKKMDDNCKIQISEKEQLKKIQAGWFGKGYKKYGKNRKR